MDKQLRDITEQEWREYEWQEVTSYGDTEPIFIRTVKKTVPTQDGFHYVEQTRLDGSVQVWKRAKTPE